MMCLLRDSLLASLTDMLVREGKNLVFITSVPETLAVEWVDILHAYGKEVTPSVKPEHLEMARKCCLKVMIHSTNMYGEDLLAQVLTVYSTLLAYGLEEPFVGTAPRYAPRLGRAFNLLRPVPAVVAGPDPQDRLREAAQVLAGEIDTWFRTGFGVSSLTGNVVYWS